MPSLKHYRAIDRSILEESEPFFRPVPMPVDVMDEEQFPLLAEMRRDYASLSPERRAELDAPVEYV